MSLTLRLTSLSKMEQQKLNDLPGRITYEKILNAKTRLAKIRLVETVIWAEHEMYDRIQKGTWISSFTEPKRSKKSWLGKAFDFIVG